MITFGLGRPVYSFGLLAIGTFFVLTGNCAFEAEDARVMLAEKLDLPVADVRIVEPYAWEQALTENEARLFYVHDFRTLHVYNGQVDRTFEVEDERTHYVKRACDVDDTNI